MTSPVLSSVKQIVYFDRPGRENPPGVIEAVKARCVELGIEHVVVASNSEETALRFWEALQDAGVTLISSDRCRLRGRFPAEFSVALSISDFRQELERYE